MVGKNNDQMLRQKEANRIERYGIRRLSVGVASVAVAGWLMMANTHFAQAAELDQSGNAPQAETLETDAQSDPELASDNEDNQAESESQATDQAESETEALATDPELKAQDLDKGTAGIEELSDESSPELAPKAYLGEPALRSANIQEIQGDAIYSPGQYGDTQSYSGTVYLYRHNKLSSVGTETLSGVNVYLQWVDYDGYVSHVYKTVSRPDGTYTFNFQNPEVDKFGNVHHFQLAANPNFSIRTWADNPNPENYEVIKPGDNKYGFHTRLNRVNENWDFTAGVNRIINGQVAFQEKSRMNDWLHKPEDQWTKAPNSEGVWTNQGDYGRVSGYVWYENGDQRGSIADGWKQDSWDVNATGTKVVASYVNDEVARRFDAWKEANPEYGINELKAGQEKIIREYEAEHGKGSHIAESVVGTVEQNGYYYLPFRGLYGVSHTQQNAGLAVSHTISDEEYGQLVKDEDLSHANLMAWNGTIGQKHRHINRDYMYVSPMIDNYAIWGNTSQNNAFEALTNNALLPVGVNNVASYNINNVNFAALAAQPMHDIKVFDSHENFARPSDTAENDTAGLLPNQQYKLRWFKDGQPIGEVSTLNSDHVGRIGSVPITIPSDLSAPAIYTSAVFYGNSEADDLTTALAADSLIAVPGMTYQPIEVQAGQEAKTEAPRFTDKEGKEYQPDFKGTKAPKFEYVKRIVTTDANDQKQVEYQPLTTVEVDGQAIKVSVDPTTGVVTVPAEETAKLSPGTQIKVPVSVVFENGLRMKADAVITIEDSRKDQEKYQAHYPAETAEFGKEFTGKQPSFKQVDLEGKESDLEFNKVPLSKDPAKPAFAIDKPTRGASIDPNTGAISLPAEELSKTPGETITVPVTVTYADGSSEQVNAEIKVTSPDVIDRTDHPDAPVPAGYHKVDFAAGEGIDELVDNKVYHVKQGSSLNADQYPTPIVKEGFTEPKWSVEAGTPIENDQTVIATARKLDPDEVHMTLTPRSQNALEHEEITPVTPELTNLPTGGRLEVTIDGQATYPGLTVNPETGLVTGTPEITNWTPEEETRLITVEVFLTDKDGQAVVDPEGNPVKMTSTITVYRDTDQDGYPDKDTGMPEDPNNPGAPGANGDKDDDNDGWTDDEEKERGTDPKQDQDFPKVTEPAAENQPGKDTSKITGKTTPNTDVIVKDKDGNVIGTGTSDDQGNINIDVPKQDADDKLTITPGKKDDNGDIIPAKDKDGKDRGQAETIVKETPQVTDLEASNNPNSDKTKLTGKTSLPHTKLLVKDKEGHEIASGQSDEQGNFDMEIDKQPSGEKILVIPTKDYQDGDQRIGDPVEATVVDSSTETHKTQVKVTPKSQNALEYQAITPVTPTLEQFPAGAGLKVTIDGKTEYPGLAIDPETGQVTGSPEIKDWKASEETRTFNVEFAVIDQDGKPVLDEKGLPVKTASTITIYRDTDKDGLPDKDTGMPVDPNNPTVPAIDQGDKDDDNDGWTDDQEKEKGTDPKDPNSKPVEDTSTDADKYDPEGQDLTSSINGHVDPADGIKNQSDLPSGTSYQFKQPVDTTRPGVKEATIVVTYPDGSQDEVQIKVTVKESTPELTDADKYEPQGQTIVTEVGGHPDPAEGIKNFDQLPKGSKVEFKEPVDTSTPGYKKTSLMVIYPDGSKDEVAITVTVLEKVSDSHNTTTDNAAAVSLLPQTGEQDATVIFGAAALSILAGLGLITKKRQED